MVEKYGADAYGSTWRSSRRRKRKIEWSDAGIEGSWRFLARVWRLADSLAETIGGEGIPSPSTLELNDAERALRRKTHETIRRVTLDLDPRVHLKHRRVGDDGAGQRPLCLLRRDPLRRGCRRDRRRRDD
jgi:leucyl-tRNA synthetase